MSSEGQLFLPDDKPLRPSDVSSTEHRRMVRLSIDFYGALSAYTAGSDPPNVAPSLVNCDSLSDRSAVSDFSDPSLSEGGHPETVDDLDYLNDATEALTEHVPDDCICQECNNVWLDTGTGECPECGAGEFERVDREAVVTELVMAGEIGHAKRFAQCRRKSVQLRCKEADYLAPDDPRRGCGSTDNYVPMHCDSRLCIPCQRRRLGEKVHEFEPVVQGMDRPTVVTLTIENMADPKKAEQQLKRAFRLFRQRRIPTEGETVRENEDGEEIRKRWVWSRATSSGPATDYWKADLREQGFDDLARRVQKRYVAQDLMIPLKELVGSGVYGIDIKQNGPSDYNVHVHWIVDMSYVPQPALSAVWEDLTGAPVVDVRRIYDRSEGVEDALLEVAGYVCKPPEFESIEDEVAYLQAFKGTPLIGTTGPLGNPRNDDVVVPPSLAALRCSECGGNPVKGWGYEGVVDGNISNMTIEDVDGPPPSADPEEQPAVALGGET